MNDSGNTKGHHQTTLTLQHRPIRVCLSLASARYLTNCPDPRSPINTPRIRPIGTTTHQSPQSAMKPHQSRTEELRSLIGEHLTGGNLRDPSPAWCIRESPLGGIGLFATRDINVGEVVFRDAPLVLGPRAVLQTPVYCVVCCAGGMDSSYLT